MSEPLTKRIRIDHGPDDVVPEHPDNNSTNHEEKKIHVAEEGGGGDKLNKKMVIINHMASLMHAMVCRVVKPDVDEKSAEPVICDWLNCSRVKMILKHIAACTMNDCTAAHCRMSKSVLSHYKNCGKCADCSSALAKFQQGQEFKKLKGSSGKVDEKSVSRNHGAGDSDISNDLGDVTSDQNCSNAEISTIQRNGDYRTNGIHTSTSAAVASRSNGVVLNGTSHQGQQMNAVSHRDTQSCQHLNGIEKSGNKQNVKTSQDVDLVTNKNCTRRADGRGQCRPGGSGVKRERYQDTGTAVATEMIRFNDVFIAVGRKEPEPGSPLIWDRRELSYVLLPVLQKVYARHDAEAFWKPVDPVALQCPDYYEIIENPIDMGTIKSKLTEFEYSDPWKFIDDMYLMFNNCWTYNKRNTTVFKSATKLCRYFNEQMSPIMKRMGYCCAVSYTFSPVTLPCSVKSVCSISPYSWYYGYKSYTVCEHCFLDGTSRSVSIEDDTSRTPLLVSKDLFTKVKNVEVQPEKLAVCVRCGRRQHTICSLHIDEIWRDGFTCHHCQLKGHHRLHNKYTAKKLSAFLQKRVRVMLGEKINETFAKSVHVHVLSCAKKTCEVRTHMKKQFPDVPAEYPYIAKTIGVFQELKGLDGVMEGEVCFFIIHSQEYGPDCPLPNKNRVYLAYMDSVNFFTPKDLRTSVYYDVLSNYMKYLKFKGFESLHLWACPPAEGDDYIFNSHPTDQKIPRPKRLHDWYVKLFDKAVKDEAIYSYRDLYDDVIVRGVKSPDSLPYFDGDFWATLLEELISEVKPVLAIQQSVESLSPTCDKSPASELLCDESIPDKTSNDLLASCSAVGNPVSGSSSTYLPGLDDKVECDTTSCQGSPVVDKTATLSEPTVTVSAVAKKKSNKKKNSKSKKQKKQQGKKKAVVATGPQDLQSRVMAAINRYKESFFVVLMQRPGTTVHCSGGVETLVGCDLMEVRGNFLLMARDEHCEFSSLRRAMFSTLVLLYEVHREIEESARKSHAALRCSNCAASQDQNAFARSVEYQCTVCKDEFQVCGDCYQTVDHCHPVERLPGAGGEERVPFSFSSQRGSSYLLPSTVRRRRVMSRGDLREVQPVKVAAVEHAWSCAAKDCLSVWCPRIKTTIEHWRTCTSSSCAHCVDLHALIDMHASVCVSREGACAVCSDATVRSQASRRHRARQQALFMQRRAAVMNNEDIVITEGPSL